MPTPISPPQTAYVYVVNRFDNTIQRLTNEGERARNLQWSTTEDLLLFEVYTESNLPTTYRVYDLTHSEVSISLEQADVGLITAHWTPSNLLATYTIFDESDQTSLMRVYSPSGDLLIEREILSVGQNVNPNCLATWSPTNQVVYVNQDKTLVVENINSTDPIEFLFDMEFVLDAVWSPNGRFALIYGSNNCDPYAFGEGTAWGRFGIRAEIGHEPFYIC